MEMIRQNQQSSYHPDAGDYALPGLMQEMGYRDEDRYEAQYKENIWNNPVYGFYAKVKNNSDFKSRVRDLPSYAGSYSPGNDRRANEDELMTAMLVVEDAIPATCENNSPNSYAESHANLYSDIVSKGAVRNSCFSAIAFDTRVPALCAKIIPVEGNLPELNYVDRENCEDGIRVAIQNNEKLLSHNPQYFSRMDDFVRALRKLGYDKPFLIDQNAPDWSAFYRHLMYYAKPGEKQEFLRRAEALPSFTK